MATRCGKCTNCKQLAYAQSLALKDLQPYQLHNGQLVIHHKVFDVDSWNRELALHPCTGLFPVYEVRVKYSTDHPDWKWEDLPLWDKTVGGISMEELRDSTIAYLKTYMPYATEIRINEQGNLQGHYFEVK